MSQTKPQQSDTIDRTPEERVDVCIVGAGPAGSVLANALAERGYDVVILEAGPQFDPDERVERMKQHLRPEHGGFEVWDMGGERDAYTSSGENYFALNGSRVKGVGGSTLHWTACTPRLYPKDFELETRFGIGRDWPIDYSDLQPYYIKAEQELGVAGDVDNPLQAPRDEDFPMDAFPAAHSDTLFAEACDSLDIEAHLLPNARNSEPYDDRPACMGYGTCSPVCPSKAQYSADVHANKANEKGVRVIDRAPVQRLEHDSSGDRIEAAVYATPDGEEYEQEARKFVVACGGIETPRVLLLSSSEMYPNGLANTSGAVGKYLMDHPQVFANGRLTEPTRQNHVAFSSMGTHDFYHREEATPGSLHFQFFTSTGPLLTDIALTDGSWGDELLEKIDLEYGERVSLTAMAEQLPEERNRVTLDPSQTDDHGNPVPNISWNVGSHATASLEEARQIQDRILREMGATGIGGTSHTDPGIGTHPMGTTRMGTDPETSVVNPQLRTHDLENLFISSSSVFVTGGASNPTLTIVALTLRLAEHLDQEL